MPPPRNVLTDTTPSEITPVRGRDQDVFVPARSWRGKVPPELAKEIAGLRRHDARIGDALKDAATSQRFLVSPTSVLDDLKIPLSEGLRGRLSGRTGMDVLATPHRLRLPGNPVISPDVNVRIQEKSDETPGLPSPGGLVRLWNLFPNLFKPTGALDHGYPVVYEITKACIHDLITQWFDRGPLANMIDGITQQVTDPVLQGAIKLADLAYQDFDLDLDLGMPEGQTTSYPDVMTITLRVPRPDSNATPSTGTVSVSILLRLAASVVVDHTDPQKEEFYLDLAHFLADCEATLTVANLPVVGTQVVDLSSSFATFLKENYPKVKVFFDVPVDRSGRSELKPTQVDVRIIDDPTSSDCDAIVLLLSFSDSRGHDPERHRYRQYDGAKRNGGNSADRPGEPENRFAVRVDRRPLGAPQR